MAYGVTDAGFVLKRLADILTDLQTNLQGVVDPVTGESLTVDLADENDPLVQVVNSFADGLSVAWEQLQLAYNQFDPLKATGAGLSGTVQLNAILRKGGTPSTVTLTLTGTPGLVMAAGKKVSPMDDSSIFVLPAVTFDGSGDASVVATCNQNGPTAALAGTLVKIVTPTTGWKTVTNSADATVGTAEETDTALRARQQVSTASTGRGMIDDLFGAISNLTDVTYCRAYQNTAADTDERGIPGHSVAVVVLGGDDTEIAQTVFEHMPIGALTYGDQTVTIADEQGFLYEINFNRPTEVGVYISISIHPLSSSWPTDGVDQVKAALLDYGNTITPGTSVYASQLYSPVNALGGVQITALTIGTTASPTGDSVVVDWNEAAIFDSARIVVTEV